MACTGYDPEVNTQSCCPFLKISYISLSSDVDLDFHNTIIIGQVLVGIFVFMHPFNHITSADIKTSGLLLLVYCYRINQRIVTHSCPQISAQMTTSTSIMLSSLE